MTLQAVTHSVHQLHMASTGTVYFSHDPARFTTRRKTMPATGQINQIQVNPYPSESGGV
jgi:hypothetical protein